MATLAEALRHGEAVHEGGYPWRIHAGKPEVGIPQVDDDNAFVRDEDDQLVLDWYPVREDEVFDKWTLKGWRLL
jgi:hypothetical protein